MKETTIFLLGQIMGVMESMASALDDAEAYIENEIGADEPIADRLKAVSARAGEIRELIQKEFDGRDDT